MPGPPLLDSDQTEESRLTVRLLLYREVPIVVGFLTQEGYRDQAKSGLDAVDPEWPAPRKTSDHE